MFSLTRILLPVDFSDRSISAARYAVQLAGHFDSEIAMLHVLAPIMSPPNEYPELYGGVISQDLLAERRAQAGRQLDAFLEAELRGPRVTRVVKEGDPASEIIEQAHSGDTGLIMMPTHGYGPFRRFLLGSVTAKVLHGAACPVWTGIHLESGPPSEPIRLKHIACAVDLGSQSPAVLDWAAKIAAEFTARLTLIYVVSLDPRTEAYYFSPEWRGQLVDYARADIDKLQATLGTHAEVRLETGDVHKAVRTAVESLGADLLVIGRSAMSGISGRLPTDAYAIIRDSPCPVVSV